MSSKKEMSFLPDEENANSFSARIIKWVTTVGRFIIVFTELIVVCAFLSRFWLDRTNSDLSESVRQQKAILASTSDFENEYSQLQKRLKLIKSFYSSQPEYLDKIEALTSSVPPGITFDQLSVKQDLKTQSISAQVKLFAYQETSIVDLITNLIANPKISSVDIQTIEKKPKNSKYDVSLSLIFTSPKK
jgi:hypothetical protein